MKRYSVLFAALLALIAVSACQKKESAPAPATAPADAAKPGAGDTTAPAAPAAPAPEAPAEK